MSDSLGPHGRLPARLPCPWDSPGKNPGVGCHALLQGLFLTQGSNPGLLCLLHWQAGYFTTGESFLGKPMFYIALCQKRCFKKQASEEEAELEK